MAYAVYNVDTMQWIWHKSIMLGTTFDISMFCASVGWTETISRFIVSTLSNTEQHIAYCLQSLSLSLACAERPVDCCLPHSPNQTSAPGVSLFAHFATHKPPTLSPLRFTRHGASNIIKRSADFAECPHAGWTTRHINLLVNDEYTCSYIYQCFVFVLDKSSRAQSLERRHHRRRRHQPAFNLSCVSWRYEFITESTINANFVRLGEIILQ